MMSTLVVDTNFLLSNLGIVKELVDGYNIYSHCVIIPGAVLDELDGLKSGQGSSARQARSAITYIQTALAQSHPGIRGQKLSEFVQTGQRGDDSILDCCRFFAARSFTVLCSNDRNLCAKALSNDLKTVSYVPGMTAVQISVRVSVAAGYLDPAMGEKILQEQGDQRTASAPPRDSTPDSDHEMVDMEDEAPISMELTMPEPAELAEEHYHSVSNLERDVKDTLYANTAALIDYRIRQSYDSDELSYFKYSKPPNNAKMIYQVLEKYRLGVFTEYIPRRVFSELSNFIQKPSSNLNKSGFEHFIDLWGSIVIHLSKNDLAYRHAVNSLRMSVEKFYA